eukprot:NODE_482_length_6938_cov_0.582541.p2 type:complete len:294 gc:universal NODE_482_length_6938_cov_0.582541:2327-3208(+)
MHPFGDNDFVKMQAPMVRYSKLAFRELIRDYNVDITTTPMILAKEFHRNQKAREMEFCTSKSDHPLIVQFASQNATDLRLATQLIMNYSVGVDLNCGCPQSWAISEGIGAYLSGQPELVADMIKQLQMICPSTYSKSIKIRLHNNLQITTELMKRAEMMGIDFITVHGRTRSEMTKVPVRIHDMKILNETVQIPVIANGDVFSLQDAQNMIKSTRCRGVSVARGLLMNPELFTGASQTSWNCIYKYLDLGVSYGTHPFIISHHLSYMMVFRVSLILLKKRVKCEFIEVNFCVF